MEIDYMYLGPTPTDEDCAQLGQDGYRAQAVKEMNTYIAQLYRTFTDVDQFNVRFKIKWENHDFGTYGEVVAIYDASNQESTKKALDIEWQLPEKWDDEALEELQSN